MDLFVAILNSFAIFYNSLAASPLLVSPVIESKCYIEVKILSNNPNLQAVAGT